MPLRPSIALLSAALADSQGEQDDFQQRYLASSSEAENLRGIQADLDARYRIRLNELSKARRDFQAEERMSWLRQLLEWQQEASGTDDFLEAVKTDIFRLCKSRHRSG